MTRARGIRAVSNHENHSLDQVWGIRYGLSYSVGMRSRVPPTVAAKPELPSRYVLMRSPGV
jgi:hypothetical protein